MTESAELTANHFIIAGLDRFKPHRDARAGNGEPDQQHRLDQNGRKFEVGGNSAANTCMIGLRLAAPAESDQHKNKKGRPSKEQRAHEPVGEFQNVIDLVAMLGGVWRLAKKFVNEREATHRICPNLLR